MIRFACLLILLLPFYQVVSAKVWHVSTNGKLRDIQIAVDAAQAGDTIIVEAGVYKPKNIIITKSLSLIGNRFPVLDGERKYEIISVKSNDVLVEGFEIRNSGHSSYNDVAAIKLYDARRCTIRNNRLLNNFFSIYNLRSTNCVIQNNNLQSNPIDETQSGNGIHCWKSDSMKIIGNVITGHRDGIYFEFVTNSTINNNVSEKNLRYGLHFMFSNDDKYTGNTFSNNGAGVAVMFSKGVHMYNNVFSDNIGEAAYGILLKEISDSDIKDNIFRDNTIGIYMEGTNRIKAHGNEFRQNGYALRIQASCADNELVGNNFIGNTFDVATNGSLVLNRFSKNYWDKYEGYDLNRNGVGDVPYRPVSMYSMIVEQNGAAMMLYRSFMVTLLDKAEKVIPSITPENLIDNDPMMKPLLL
jgi:nitrous oxidase accessory protein